MLVLLAAGFFFSAAGMTIMPPPVLVEEEMFELFAAGEAAEAAADVSLTLPTTRALTWSTGTSGDLVVVLLLNWN